MYAKTFWSRLRTIIKNKKTTQEITAKSCGISLNTWRGWGSKNIIPCVMDCIRISRYLDVNIEYLLLGKERNSQVKIAEIQKLLEKTAGKLTALR